MTQTKGWISPWAFHNSETGVFECKDYNPKGTDAPTWTLPSEDATLLYEDGSGDIPISGSFKKGTYASPADLGSATVFGFGQFWGAGSGSDTFIIGMQLFVKTTESARPFPLCVQAEIDNDGATYPDRGEAAQFIILLGGGGEASKLGALGDSTAGMYASWHKVGAGATCSTESGCRVAPLWIDNQMYCVVNGEEYAAFITTGGSKPDAVFGFETTSVGWAQLLYFDETAYNKDPISSNYLKILLNTTQLYIPTSTTAGSFTGTLGANTVTGTLTFTTGDLVMGSYASPQDLGSSTTFGFGQFWGSGSGASDPYIIGMQFFVKTTQTARPFPLCVQAEIDNDGSTYPDRGEAAQFIILLGGGGEASKLGALGDSTAGMYATWHKVGAGATCSTESGCRVAPLWIDNQMYCVVNGEEYAAFITTGGSVPDAVFGFETTSSGWAQLLYFDETAYNKNPISSNYLKILLNTTQLYIPTSTTAGSFTGTLGANTVTGTLTFTTGRLVMGSYGSPQDLGSSTTFGFGQFWGSGSGASDPFIIGMQYFVKTTQTARPFPLCVQAEINNDGSTYPDRGQAAQFIILLGGGGEASKLGAVVDSTGGMYAGWFKVGANTLCSTEAGARVAPLWIDNQMNCVVNGEEYAAFITCGGSKPDAVFGLETTSSGWSYLFLFDETSYDQDPVGAGNITGGDKDYNFKCSINGVGYGIQLYKL